MIAFLSLYGNGVCCVTDLIMDLIVIAMADASFSDIYIGRGFFCELAVPWLFF